MSAETEFKRLAGRLLIDGAMVPSASTDRMPVIDPATEDRISEIADATADEVQAAIAAANRAFPAWRATNMLTRAELMHQAAAEIRNIRPLLGRDADAGNGQALQGILRRGLLVDLGHRLLRRGGAARERPRHRPLRRRPVPLHDQRAARRRRDHPALQLSPRAARLGGCRRARGRQRGDRQAVGGDLAHDPALRRGVPMPAQGAHAMRDGRRHGGSPARRQPARARRRVHGRHRNRKARREIVCGDLQALPHRGVGERSLHRHAERAA